MFNSLRVRLTVLFAGLTIVPLIIVGALIAQQGFDRLQNESVKVQDQIAQKTAISLEAFFAERQNELLVLTDVYGLDSLEPEAQKDVLLTLLSKQPAYYELTLVQPDGQETLRMTRGEVVTTDDLASRADDPLFQSVVETGSINFSPIYFNETARDRLITLAVPIENLFTGEVSQALIGELRFQNVGEAVLRDLDLTEGEDVFIVDSNGIVVAHRNPTLVLQETIFDLPESNGRHGGLTEDDVVLAMDTIELGDFELIVVAETTYANATALARNLVELSAIITVITLLIAGSIVTWSVNRVVNPIIRISRVAQAIQHSDFSKRIEMNRKDEIGQFATSFNAMVDAVQQREQNLREQADALRIASARAKEAARIKGEFLANVSHELRTPLNAIIGFSDMLLMGMSGDLNEKQEQKMRRLRENGIRLLNLINDILDLTRIESMRVELVPTPFAPHDLFTRISGQMEVLAQQEGIAFEVEIAPHLPEQIVGDEKRIEQVVVNLLSNAIKFTEEGTVKFEIKADLKRKSWSIIVSDTGIGIPPHARNLIFEEFRQLDGTSTRAYKGTGLGLAITRNLVRIMGGTIGVESELGRGSVFTVTLPLSTEDTPDTDMVPLQTVEV